MHYKRYESNKTFHIFYISYTLLQQSVFGIIHALWEILWTFEQYRDTDVDYQRYDRRWYRSLNDTAVDKILKTTFHVPVLKYMIYSMTITEISTIRQISLGTIKKIVCFVRTGVLKVATVTKNNSTLNSPVYRMMSERAQALEV